MPKKEWHGKKKSYTPYSRRVWIVLAKWWTVILWKGINITMKERSQQRELMACSVASTINTTPLLAFKLQAYITQKFLVWFFVIVQ